MTTNCPVCGHHMTPMDSPKNRVSLNGLDLPICNCCAQKKRELAKQIENSTPKDIATLRTPENHVFIDTLIDENPKLMHKKSSKISGNIAGFAFVQGRRNPTTNGEN